MISVDEKDGRIALTFGSRLVLDDSTLYDELDTIINETGKSEIVFDFNRLICLHESTFDTIFRIVDNYILRGKTFFILNPDKSQLKVLVLKKMNKKIKILNTP